MRGTSAQPMLASSMPSRKTLAIGIKGRRVSGVTLEVWGLRSRDFPIGEYGVLWPSIPGKNQGFCGLSEVLKMQIQVGFLEGRLNGLQRWAAPSASTVGRSAVGFRGRHPQHFSSSP